MDAKGKAIRLFNSKGAALSIALYVEYGELICLID